MPVATSSPIKRSAEEGEEKKEGSSREASPASKRQKLDAAGSSSGSGGKQARTVSPTKPDGSKVKAGLPKLDVAAAASRASDTAAGGLFCSSNIRPAFFPQGKVVKEQQLHFLTHQLHLTHRGRRQRRQSRKQRQKRGRECSCLCPASQRTSLTGARMSMLSLEPLCSHQVCNVPPRSLTKGNHQEGDADDHWHLGWAQCGDCHGWHCQGVCWRSS